VKCGTYIYQKKGLIIFDNKVSKITFGPKGNAIMVLQKITYHRALASSRMNKPTGLK
jgi:hypothetical protein